MSSEIQVPAQQLIAAVAAAQQLAQLILREA
jgi:hypothetical protein